jgi:hypothetical protein
MNYKAFLVAGTALALATVAPAQASLIGMTYTGTATVSGNTQIIDPNTGEVLDSPLTGTYTAGGATDFFVCLGPAGGCAHGSGLSVVTTITDSATPGEATIGFSTWGGTTGATGPVTIDLTNFSPADGQAITGITVASNPAAVTINNVSATDINITFAPSGWGGTGVTFNVTQDPVDTPEPASFALLAVAAAGIVGIRRRNA